MTCAICKRAYDGVQPFVSCEGHCSKNFHIDCVKMTKTSHKLISTNKQYKWFCPDCSNTTIMHILNELHSLSSEVNRLSSLIDKSEATSSTPMVVEMATEWIPITASSSAQVEIVNGDEVITIPSQKRSRSASASQLEDVIYVEETINFPKKRKNSAKQPTSKNLKNKKPIQTVNQIKESMVTPRITAQQLSSALETPINDNVIAPLSAIEAKKWLFISRLDPHTSESQVVHHLATKLEISQSEIVCKKLIKKGISEDRIMFMSFKVGLKPSLFDKANNRLFWPPSTIVHEFKPRSKNWPRLPAVTAQTEGRH